MTRQRGIIIQAMLLAMIGAMIPVLVAIYFSWSLVQRYQRDELHVVSETVIGNIDRILADAARTLRSVTSYDFVPCSPGHIARMRELTMMTPHVDSIGYSKDGFYRCSIWGLINTPVPRATTDYVQPDGIEIVFGVSSQAARQTEMMGLRLDDHVVLINPASLLNYGLDPGVSIALISRTGRVVATQNHPPLDLVARLGERDGSDVADGYAYAVARRPLWNVVALEEEVDFSRHLREQKSALIFIALLVTPFSAIAAIWFSRRRMSLFGELSLAVQKREFIVYYQPIIELRTNRCLGAEALVRWRRPDGTMVRPDEFIPLAESSGLILPITDLVIERVILDLNAMLVKDRSLHVAINLSASDIETGRFLPILESALRCTGIQPRQIMLEATERGFIDAAAARITLNEARRHGYIAAIDDFGTGYSNLQHLQTLPLTALKIDKSFVDTIGTGAATSAVTAHIIDMAQALNLLIVAEGVETEEQVRYLTDKGVDFAQGWFFSKALPTEEFIAFHNDRLARYGAGDKIVPPQAAVSAPPEPATHP